MTKIIMLIILIVFNFSAYAENIPSPCNKKENDLREKKNKICEAKKQKSEKTWPDLESAKKAILGTLNQNDAAALIPYVGCDTVSLPKYEIYCLAQETLVKEDHIYTLFKKIEDQKSSIDIVEWTNYGLEKDIYLLCSKTYATKVAENFCNNKKYRPIIEIRKSKEGYYIFGIAINDEKP